MNGLMQSERERERAEGERASVRSLHEHVHVCMCMCYICSPSIERAGECASVRAGREHTSWGTHDDMTKHLDWVEAWVAILQRNLQSVDNTHTHTHTSTHRSTSHTHTAHKKK